MIIEKYLLQIIIIDRLISINLHYINIINKLILIQNHVKRQEAHLSIAFANNNFLKIGEYLRSAKNHTEVDILIDLSWNLCQIITYEVLPSQNSHLKRLREKPTWHSPVTSSEVSLEQPSKESSKNSNEYFDDLDNSLKFLREKIQQDFKDSESTEQARK